MRILGLLCFVLLVGLSETSESIASEKPLVIQLEHAKYLEINAENPTSIPKTAVWHDIQLPDSWRVNHKGYAGEIWYYFFFDLPQKPSELWAVYLPRVSMNAEVFVNGLLVGSGGSFTTPIARNWNRPLFFNFNPALLYQGKNTLFIHVKTERMDIGRLLPVFIGEASVLQGTYETSFFEQITLLEFFAFLSLIASFLSGWFWLKHRSQVVYAWYALGTLSWAMFIAYFVVRDIPVSRPFLWGWITFSSCYWMIGSMMLFVNELLHQKKLWMKHWVIGYSILVTIFLLLSPEQHFFSMVAILFLPYVILVAYIFFILLYQAFNTRSVDLITVSAGIAFNFVFGLHDMLALFMKWTPPNYKLQYGVPVMLLVMAVVLVRRYSQSLIQAEKLSVKVAKNELVRQQAIIHEREKIMRDIHDNIGGNIVSALSISEKQDRQSVVAEILRHTLNDMRIIIDALDPEENDLFMMLAMLRHRFDLQLKQHGIDLQWKVEDLDTFKQFDAIAVLQISRIIQEALTNAIKHANASIITLRSGHRHDEYGKQLTYIEVSDNGNGFDKNTTLNGKGLKNIHYRANEIGVDLEVKHHNNDAQNQGITVRLIFPLE